VTNIIPPEDAMLYLGERSSPFVSSEGFRHQPRCTPIPNIEDFNDEPIKNYRFVKTVAQYNEIVRVLTYWADDTVSCVERRQ
jgi:hypothetical protein